MSCAQLGSSAALAEAVGSMQPLLSGPRTPKNKIQDSTVSSPKETSSASPGITAGTKLLCGIFQARSALDSVSTLGSQDCRPGATALATL